MRPRHERTWLISITCTRLFCVLFFVLFCWQNKGWNKTNEKQNKKQNTKRGEQEPLSHPVFVCLGAGAWFATHGLGQAVELAPRLRGTGLRGELPVMTSFLCPLLLDSLPRQREGGGGDTLHVLGAGALSRRFFDVLRTNRSFVWHLYYI